MSHNGKIQEKKYISSKFVLLPTLRKILISNEHFYQVWKLNTFWYNTLNDIQGKIPDSAMGTLVNSIEPCGFLDNQNPDIYTIKFKNQVSAANIDIKVRNVLEKHLEKYLNRKVLLEIDLSNTKTINYRWLNPLNTFDRFIQSKCNQMAFITCEAVAHQPGKSNPLYLYSNPGLGKTHLIHALIHMVLSKTPATSIYYTDFNDFRDDFINALTNKTILDYKKNLRNNDILVIENIENISNTKKSIQCEFFHIFNHFFENEKQLIFTSCEISSKLKVAANLKSRLQSGIQIQLHDPDSYLIQEIITRKSKELKLNLPVTLNKRLGKFEPTSIRELEGVLNRFYFLKQKNIDLENIDILQSSFQELYPNSDNQLFPIEAIVQYVSAEYNVTVEDLKSNSRRAEFTLPRHIGMYLAVQFSELNKSAIARFFRKSDHTTVINAEKNIIRKIEKEKGFKQNLDKIVDNIRKTCE